MGINVGFLTTSSYVDPTGFPLCGKNFVFSQNKPYLDVVRGEVVVGGAGAEPKLPREKQIRRTMTDHA